MIFDSNNSFDIWIPTNPGEVPLRASIAYYSPVAILMITGVAGLIFCTIGYSYKSLTSKGILRKKFSYLSIGSPILNSNFIEKQALPKEKIYLIKRTES